MDTYKSNADRQIMGLKTEDQPKHVDILKTLENQQKDKFDNYNIIPYPLDRLSQQLSNLYLNIIDIKKELKNSIINNPAARKKIKVLNAMDHDLDNICNIIINNIVKKLDHL